MTIKMVKILLSKLEVTKIFLLKAMTIIKISYRVFQILSLQSLESLKQKKIEQMTWNLFYKQR